MLKAGKHAGAGKLLLNPLYRFIKFYLLRLGFLDGMPGLIHILIGCQNTFLKYAKLIALQGKQLESDGFTRLAKHGTHQQHRQHCRLLVKRRIEKTGMTGTTSAPEAEIQTYAADFLYNMSALFQTGYHQEKKCKHREQAHYSLLNPLCKKKIMSMVHLPVR